PPPTTTNTLSLHDALPILAMTAAWRNSRRVNCKEGHAEGADRIRVGRESARLVVVRRSHANQWTPVEVLEVPPRDRAADPKIRQQFVVRAEQHFMGKRRFVLADLIDR